MNLLISFGPLRAYIDEVRFITNRSTGRLGYNLLREALLRRYKVKAVVGAVKFLRPAGIVEWIKVEEYQDLKKAMEVNFNWAEIIIMAAAIPDFVPFEKKSGKIPRREGVLNLKLKATESILGGLSRRKNRRNKVLVGVSLEKETPVEKAREKLQENNLDLIISLDLNSRIPPYGSNPVSIALIQSNRIEKLPLWRKSKVAGFILDRIEEIWKILVIS